MNILHLPGRCRFARTHAKIRPHNRPRLASLLAASIVAAITTLSGSAHAGADGSAAGFVYSANEHGNSISAIDLKSGEVRTLPVPISPHNVDVTADSRHLLAVGDPATEAHGHGEENASHGDDAEGKLLVFDTTDLARGPVVISVGRHPAHVVVDREGTRAFVTAAGDDAVSVVDLASRTLLQAIKTGQYPHGLRISPDGREIYVANVESDSVSVIDTAKLVEVARIDVGKAPVQVGFTPDGSRVFVSLRDADQVAVIDTQTREVLARIDVGSNPIQVYVTPDGGHVYVANQGTEREPSDAVSVIEVATGRVVDTIRTGRGAHGVTVMDDGSMVFVTNIVEGTVSAIDTASRSVVATYTVGAGPNGIAFRRESTDAEQ